MIKWDAKMQNGDLIYFTTYEGEWYEWSIGQKQLWKQSQQGDWAFFGTLEIKEDLPKFLFSRLL